MSREEKHCTFCNRSGHNANNCPIKPRCATCEHQDRNNVTSFGTYPCTQSPYPFRMARTYPAHASCDKGAYLPRKRTPQPTRDDSHDRPQLF